MFCPCGTKEEFDNCCKPFISGETLPATAEKLMRSRYTAHVFGNIDYLKETFAPESNSGFNEEISNESIKSAKWKKLKIISRKNGGPTDTQGTVEFTADYEQDGKQFEHHEVSQFKKSSDGKWFFVSGDSHTHRAGEHHHHHRAAPIVNTAAKIGRNDPCICGSAKKYKKCCGADS